MLSNAEKALRESSNTNAPVECWGCHGLFPGSDHLYKDCPHKAKPQVQERFKQKLDEFLAKRKEKRNSRFDPQTFKKDGFLTKRAVTLFNSIDNPELDGTTRLALIQRFVAECNAHGGTRQSKRTSNRRGSPVTTEESDQQGDPAATGYAMPYWVSEESEDQLFRMFLKTRSRELELLLSGLLLKA